MSKNQNINIKKWIYLLLATNNSEPIKGRIRFTKEFFLITKKLSPKTFENSEFYSYHFGPYSTRFAVCVNQMIDLNHIKYFFRNCDFNYALSAEGKKKAQNLLKNLAKTPRKYIEEIKNKSKKQSLKQMLKEIYTNNPEYVIRSIIKPDVLFQEVDLNSLEELDDGPGFVAAVNTQQKDTVLKGDKARRFLHLLQEV